MASGKNLNAFRFLLQALRQWRFSVFLQTGTVTSYTSRKVQKEFSVCFVFEKTTYMIASASPENPGGVLAKREELSLSPPALHTRTRDPRGWGDLSLLRLSFHTIKAAQRDLTDRSFRTIFRLLRDEKPNVMYRQL